MSQFFIKSIITQTFLYPLRRAQWIEQSGINLPVEDENIHNDDETLPIATILHLLSSTGPSSSSEVFRLFHGYPYYFLAQSMRLLLSRTSPNFGIILTHPLMVGVVRMGCDVSNSNTWTSQIEMLIKSQGLAFGMFRGLLPQLISSFLHRKLYRTTSELLHGLIVPGLKGKPVAAELVDVFKNVLNSVIIGIVTYPFTTLSVRMQMNPDASTGEILEQLTNEGVSGIYAGFATQFVCSVASCLVHRVLTRAIGQTGTPIY